MAPRDEEAVDKIFAGSMENLPPLSSKVVRIFTSSTFTDMLMERNTLMEYVYPKEIPQSNNIQIFCIFLSTNIY